MAEGEPPRPEGVQLLSRIDRVLLLGGSEYVREAQTMLNWVLKAGSATIPQFYNIVSRENDVLDKFGENVGPRFFGDSRVIGQKGLATDRRHPNWLDLAIDSGTLRDWMATKGHDISGDQPNNIWDHWYYFTYRGNMRFYNAVLRTERDRWAISTIRPIVPVIEDAALADIPIPDGVPWSRTPDRVTVSPREGAE
jgi:hypothetical protein